MSENYGNEKNLSSLELLWNQAFQKLEAWVEQETKREDLHLQTARQFADKVKVNNSNIKEITNQFSKELRQWEKTSREELFTATTPLMALFPLKSYEEINNNLDQLWNKSTESAAKPFNQLFNCRYGDNIVANLEKFIEFRRYNRNLYVTNLKEKASFFQTNQLAFLKTVNNQVKNVLFPFHNYMERAKVKLKA
ncbi:hypothetical protein ACIFOT_15670 [Neobacillus sp. NRS-1170]|uniref:hypothetical protein n=1 Tax=Neobacillus sp. NRS-1170 TaxID=3233898 RepID=UPI003D2962CB